MTNPLDFPIITNNDIGVQINVTKMSDGSAVDLMGATIKWQMFAPGTGTPVITKSGIQILILDQAVNRGSFAFTLTETDTVTFPAGAYQHEAVITFSDLSVKTVSNGDLTLTPGMINVRKQLTSQ